MSPRDHFRFPEMKHLREKTPDSTESVAPDRRLSGARVVAVVYSSYPADPRPRRAAEALMEEGANVEVICLKETDDEARRESFNGVQITRVPLRRRRGGKLSYML